MFPLKDVMIFQQNPHVNLNLCPPDVVEYFLSHGWQQVEHPNERMLVFDGLPDDEGTAIQVGLPASENFRDYYRRVYEVVETIAGVEEREIIAVAEDIRKSSETSIHSFFGRCCPKDAGVKIFLMVYKERVDQEDSAALDEIVVISEELGLYN